MKRDIITPQSASQICKAVGVTTEDIRIVRMLTSSAKGKGRKLQQHVCAIIQKVFSLPVTDVVSCSMGASGIDVKLSDRALQELPLSIECKNTKKFPSLSALEQSQANKLEGTTAAVAWKPFGKGYNKTIIYFDLEEFLELWEKHGEK